MNQDSAKSVSASGRECAKCHSRCLLHSLQLWTFTQPASSMDICTGPYTLPYSSRYSAQRTALYVQDTHLAARQKHVCPQARWASEYLSAKHDIEKAIPMKCELQAPAAEYLSFQEQVHLMFQRLQALHIQGVSKALTSLHSMVSNQVLML